METLSYLIVILIGLVVGSFLNVVIFRMRELHTVVNTRSHCLECKKEIAWYDLIPFFSFFLLKTRCRNCKKPISWQYPLVEAGTAILFLLFYLKFGLTWDLMFQCLIGVFLIVIFVYDLKHSLIPDEMLYPAIVLAVIYAATQNMAIFKMALLSFAISLGFFLLIYLLGKGKWMGLGDVKLSILLGFLAPFPNILIVLFFAFIIGSIVGIILIFSGKKTLKSEIPFGPFMIIGLYLGIFFSDQILAWYLNLI